MNHRLSIAQRPQTQVERIAELERRDRSTDERLQKIETTVAEIRDLLVAAKGVIWVWTKIAAWITGAAVVVSAGIALIRFIMGH